MLVPGSPCRYAKLGSVITTPRESKTNQSRLPGNPHVNQCMRALALQWLWDPTSLSDITQLGSL